MIRSVNMRVLVTMKRYIPHCDLALVASTQRKPVCDENLPPTTCFLNGVRKKAAILILLCVCILRNQTIIIIVFPPKQREYYFRTSLASY